MQNVSLYTHIPTRDAHSQRLKPLWYSILSRNFSAYLVSGFENEKCGYFKNEERFRNLLKISMKKDMIGGQRRGTMIGHNWNVCTMTWSWTVSIHTVLSTHQVFHSSTTVNFTYCLLVMHSSTTLNFTYSLLLQW